MIILLSSCSDTTEVVRYAVSRTARVLTALMHVLLLHYGGYVLIHVRIFLSLFC